MPSKKAKLVKKMITSVVIPLAVDLVKYAYTRKRQLEEAAKRAKLHPAPPPASENEEKKG